LLKTTSIFPPWPPLPIRYGFSTSVPTKPLMSCYSNYWCCNSCLPSHCAICPFPPTSLLAIRPSGNQGKI